MRQENYKVNKQKLAELRAELQQLEEKMEELHEMLAALEFGESEEEEEELIMYPTPPPNSPTFLPMMQGAIAAPKPQQGSGWLCTLMDLVSVSPGR